MKKIHCISAAVLFVGSLSANDFVPTDGDVVRMTGIEWIDVPIPDSDHPFDKALPLIDLTKAERFDEFEISYMFLSDSVLCELRPDSRREFLLTGDSLRLMTTEAHDVIIREQKPPIWISFPLSAESLTESESERKVLRFQRDHYVGKGTVVQGYAGKCDLVMLSTDTIRNVTIHSTCTVCRYSLPKLLDYPESDSAIDSTALYIEEVNSWYSPVSRYPLLQSWSTEVSANGMILYRSRSSAAVLPEDLPYDPDRNSYSVSSPDREPTPSGSGYDPACLTVDATGSNLDIQYAAQCDMEMEMILTDVLGHVYASMPRRQLKEGDFYDFHVNRSALPPGDYVLYINVGIESFTEKIPLR